MTSRESKERANTSDAVDKVTLPAFSTSIDEKSSPKNRCSSSVKLTSIVYLKVQCIIHCLCLCVLVRICVSVYMSMDGCMSKKI